jgi:hypothetical protein
LNEQWELLEAGMMRLIVTAHGRNRPMPSNRKLIQFHGGPLDGHRQDISERTKALPKLLDLEISLNTYRMLAKRPLVPDASTSSIAVYELRAVNGVDRYCFVAAKKPTQKPLADR